MTVFKCPICSSGEMYEHDVGYDECSQCTFFVVYDDGRADQHWTPEELERIYRQAAQVWPKHPEGGHSHE